MAPAKSSQRGLAAMWLAVAVSVIVALVAAVLSLPASSWSLDRLRSATRRGESGTDRHDLGLALLHAANSDLGHNLNHDLDLDIGQMDETEEEDQGAGGRYLVGAAKADITGPVFDGLMAGYVDPAQRSTGLRQRLYSRTVVVAERQWQRPPLRRRNQGIVAYVVLDCHSGDTALRRGILDGVAALGPDFVAAYGPDNVVVTGTHSHAGPGGWYNYLMHQIFDRGFARQNYDAIVSGAVLSLRQAHQSLQEGYLDVGTARVDGVGINRSPFAYVANPASERAEYDADIDRTMTVLRLRRASDRCAVASIAWYAVHATSLLSNNTLIAGDNMGVAADLLERAAAASPADFALGFVAAFAPTALGDVTPNVLGAWCDDGSGSRCRHNDSTCAGMNWPCRGRGPAFLTASVDAGAASCFEIGRRMFDGAKRVLASMDLNGSPIVGSTVRSSHRFTDLAFANFTLQDRTSVQTCPPAFGLSVAGGTTDGSRKFGFVQGMTATLDHGTDNRRVAASRALSAGKPVLAAVMAFLLPQPRLALSACQGAKPVLLDTDTIRLPLKLAPSIVDSQVVRIGQLFLVASPGEPTTMAGRRWRKAVAQAAAALVEPAEPIVVVSGPANTYVGYITTPEEYAVQRYEGASTLYGPSTLDAFINLTLGHLPALHHSAPDPALAGPAPPDGRHSVHLQLPVLYDALPHGAVFGDCTLQPRLVLSRGDTASAEFIGASPRNNLRTGRTFAAVEIRRQPDGVWERVRDDADWFLTVQWRHHGLLHRHLRARLHWHVEPHVRPGTYRFRYYGDARSLVSRRLDAFDGASDSFEVA